MIISEDPIVVRNELPPEGVADWLVSRAGEAWSKAYHHGGALWHRALRMERFATLLDDHNPDCRCEDTTGRSKYILSLRWRSLILWGGGAHSPVAEKYLVMGQYGMYEPSEYLDSLSSPA